MRADYDSEADALSIALREVKHYDDQEGVDADYCVVGLVDGKAVSVGLLAPAKHVDLLEVAAERYGLDAPALVAAAQAALAAPDRIVKIDVGVPLAA